MERETDGQSDNADRQTDRQTDRLTDGGRYGERDRKQLSKITYSILFDPDNNLSGIAEFTQQNKAICVLHILGTWSGHLPVDI